MTIEQLEQRIGDSASVRQLERRYDERNTLRIRGMAGSLFAIVAGHVARRKGGVHLIVAGDRDEASYLCNDLTNLAGSQAVGNILFTPPLTNVPYRPCAKTPPASCSAPPC